MYQSAQGKYFKFCTDNNILAIPTNEHTLCYYVSHLALECKLKYQSVKCYLSAVRHLQITDGFTDPYRSDMPRLNYVMKGIKRVQGENGMNRPNPRLPITPDILKQVERSVVPLCHQVSRNNALGSSIYCLFWFSSFRRADCS